LSGKEVIFECELVALEGQFGILKYVIDQQWQVHGLTLRPGTATYAFYWTDRPYNLYWWLDEQGETVAYYFNLADSVNLSAQEFIWRDLIVDILVVPASHGDAVQEQIRVVDEDEVPDALDRGLRACIEAAKKQVLRDYPAIVEEVTAILGRYVHFG
jgi:predicted RNA-binding protein associated with RNAse of E/G family